MNKPLDALKGFLIFYFCKIGFKRNGIDDPAHPEGLQELFAPVELKREIDTKLITLYQLYSQKNQSQKVNKDKKIKPVSIRKYIIQPEEKKGFRCHS